MSIHGSRSILATLVIVGSLIISGCTTSDTATPASAEPLPSWIIEVLPTPAATYSSSQGVRVNYVPLDTHQTARLIIDGVDVTADSSLTSSGLYYDNNEPGPVDLTAGKHTAEIQLVESLTSDAGFVVVDTYSWTFRSS